VLADSDTRWKWGALTARRILPGNRKIDVVGFLLHGRATPTARQLAEVGVEADALREVTVADVFHELRDDQYDVVVLALVGGAVQALLHGLAALRLPKRPVIVTGYVGVVYEKLSDGLLLRHGADLVLANSRYDAQRFRAVYEGVGADSSSVVEAALPFLGGATYVPEEGRDTLVFAAQPSVPDSRTDRAHLLRRLVDHARLHPRRTVVLKLRSQVGEQTTHVEEHPYQVLAEKVPGGLPDNFKLVYGNMGEVLDRTDLLVTISSTAALESLHRRIPTAVLTDFGVREGLGNHHFIGSGCLASWDQLDSGYRPAVDAAWARLNGVVADGSYDGAFDQARDHLAKLLDGAELPPIRPYYTVSSASGYLPGLLARYHLGTDGTPTSAASDNGSGLGRTVRRTVRIAARGAYRQGVQRVAPVIRRMGQL